jgi:hypothetical protein
LDLDDWVGKFTLVETSRHPMGFAGYELAENDAADTKAFKTTSKRKKQEGELPAYVDLLLTFIPNVTEYLEGRETFEHDQLVLVISTLEDVPLNKMQHLISLSNIYEDNMNLANNQIKQLFDKANTVTAALGSRPRDLGDDVSALTLWGLFGALALKVDETSTANKPREFEQN